VSENLKFVLKATGWDDESKINSRITEVLEKVHITELINKYPSQLSGGEQQKVAIARALLNNPKLIIADEPTGNLDPKTSLEVMDILIELNQKGNTILMATHDFILIDKFPNKTYICESGKISEIDLKNKTINTIYK
ncbi:MAG: cell division ATP-binding protein FtsE, partial [Flavobacteriaceae bacterium]